MHRCWASMTAILIGGAPPDDLRPRRGALRLAPARGRPRRGHERRRSRRRGPADARKPRGTSPKRGGCNGRSRRRHRCSRSAPASATTRSSAPMPRGPKPSRPTRRRINSWPSSVTSCGIRWRPALTALELMKARDPQTFTQERADPRAAGRAHGRGWSTICSTCRASRAARSSWNGAASRSATRSIAPSTWPTR